MSNRYQDDELPNLLSSVNSNHLQEIEHRSSLWRSNYHEAAIYIEEGLNNDKFENHPRKRAAAAAAASLNPQPTSILHPNQPAHYSDCLSSGTPAYSRVYTSDGHKSKRAYLLGGQYTTIETYILVHNRYFYQLDLVASIILLALALVEQPSVESYELNPHVHASIEIFALVIIAIELLLKFRWMGPRRFFHHGRTVVKLAVLLFMNLEAIIVLLRHSSHPRYSRALRPIFLIDNHYCHGIRRAIRQIFQSLPPIIDMFTLGLFFLFVFSIFGFYLFASHSIYFEDMGKTVTNLLILATTANLPDIMLPSYNVSRWSTIFFVLFIIIFLFMLTNLTMAAVYESFTRREKEKFHKLLLHRRKACQESFKLLVSRKNPTQIQYRQFMGLMRYLNRKCSMFDAYLIFKALDTDKNGSISLEEFYQIYDVINLEWKIIYPVTNWYDFCDCIPKSCKRLLALNQKVVKHRFFEWAVDICIAALAFLQFVEASALDLKILGVKNYHLSQENIAPEFISTTVFIILFIIEALMRVLALGLKDYWKQRWNRFDLVVLIVSTVGIIMAYCGDISFGWVLVLRTLRLMRVFEFKRRYKDIWQTLTYMLLKRFVSMTCVVMILYYFFAILGMELLSQYDLRNCCKNTSLESQFKFDNTTETTKYYLNDFGDLVASYLTLFSMSSSTAWLIIMNAYVIVTQNAWIRLYFALYYLCNIIVINIVVAFILESFLFRIHYRSKMGKDCDDTNLFTVRVTLSWTEVEFLRKNFSSHISNDSSHALLMTLEREHMIPMGSDDERMGLLSKKMERPTKRKSKTRLNSEKAPTGNENTSIELNKNFYLIYQAEQIRNKFSYTMKMYADEVEGWLAEAARYDQDEVGAIIVRNQIRAEHVAMARLARRNLAVATAIREDGYQNLRGRSWSTSGSVAVDGAIASGAGSEFSAPK